MIGRDQIEYASATDPGIRRTQNEDSQAVSLAVDDEQWQRQGHIFLVADGMGGHAVGELASELASNLIPHTYHKNAGDGPAPALRKAFLEANASIHARGQQNLDFKGMGTTCTALVVGPEDAWIGHVGDSRAYRIRHGQIEQLTFDHSWVWEMARRSKVDPESLKGVGSNFINRSLGPDPLVEVDIEGPHPIQQGDIFVLCSDGLSNQLSDLEIGAVVQVLPPDEACRLLAQLANLRGGPDNITVLVARAFGTSAPNNVSTTTTHTHVSQWSRSIPWPLVGLFLGVAFATSAAVLSGSDRSNWSVFLFVLAALFVGAGLAGLARKYLRDQKRQAPAFVPHPLQIYRKTACNVEGQLVSRMAHAEAALNDWTRSINAPIDWTKHQQHRRLAEEAMRGKDHLTAFREYCRAISQLLAVDTKAHTKDDGFQVFWEKTVG